LAAHARVYDDVFSADGGKGAGNGFNVGVVEGEGDGFIGGDAAAILRLRRGKGCGQ